ncbi:MAG: DUF721 domain-containing protein [Spirochaetales bacterium]|nr:DUF721 domain-containing protein [Spirochaetales bacterium]
MAYSGENKVSELITRFIDSVGARDETGVVPFVRSWPRIVGRDRAAHSRILDIRNGTVLVGVDHPAWVQRLHMDRGRIVATIQRRFPALGARYLAFTVVEHLDGPMTRDEDTVRDREDSRTDDTEHEGTPDPVRAPRKSENGHSTESSAEDSEFQRHLDGLRRALEENERRRANL